MICGSRIASLIDVRTVPKSRRNPHVWEAALARWVPERTGARYARIAELGGFRKTTSTSRNVALRNAAFRGYADYMETQSFSTALDELLSHARVVKTSIMCSETLWWRCHRRLIADAAVLLHGFDVLHLMHDGTLAPHRLTQGVRLTQEGILSYDEGVLL